MTKCVYWGKTSYLATTVANLTFDESEGHLRLYQALLILGVSFALTIGCANEKSYIVYDDDNLLYMVSVEKPAPEVFINGIRGINPEASTDGKSLSFITNKSSRRLVGMWKGGSKITWYEHPEFEPYIFNPSPFNSSGYVFSGLNTSHLDIYFSEQIRNITKFRSMDFEPSVSPDDKAIVFTSDRISNSDIYTNERPVSDRDAIENIKEWDITERGINYNTYRDHNIDIFTSDIDGSNTIRLTSARAVDYQPDWSSDGHWIVFSSLRYDNSEIFKIRTDGTDLERLTSNEYNDVQPAWSPNGNLIAFVSDRLGSKNIYVMDPDGTNQIQITSSLSGLNSPTWIKCKAGIHKKAGNTCP